VAVLDVTAFADSAMGSFMHLETLELARMMSGASRRAGGPGSGKGVRLAAPQRAGVELLVNNYLLGNKPPAFDILYWNSDTTRLPARLHADFINLLESNGLARPGGVRLAGRPLDLQQLRCDSYILAGRTDHITPWQGCYRTRALLGGRSDFVLCSSGHVQSIVSPPGNPKAGFLSTPHSDGTPEEFEAQASATAGSWWPHLAEWLAARSNAPQARPAGHRLARASRALPGPGHLRPEPQRDAPARNRQAAHAPTSACSKSTASGCAWPRAARAPAAAPCCCSTASAPASRRWRPSWPTSPTRASSPSTRRASAPRRHPPLPYRLRQVARLGARTARQPRHRAGRRAGRVLGRRGRAGVRAAASRSLPHPHPGGHLRRLRDGARQADVMLMLLSPRRYLDPAYMLRVGGRLYGGVLRFEQDLLEMHADAMRGPTLRGYLYQLLAVWGWTSWHRLRRLQTPALPADGQRRPHRSARQRATHRRAPAPERSWRRSSAGTCSS
jgi:hypothetical protein